MDGVKKRYTETLHFFCFLATDLRIIRIYTELHGGFLKWMVLKSDTQSPKLRTFYFFYLKEFKRIVYRRNVPLRGLLGCSDADFTADFKNLLCVTLRKNFAWLCVKTFVYPLNRRFADFKNLLCVTL